MEIEQQTTWFRAIGGRMFAVPQKNRASEFFCKKPLVKNFTIWHSPAAFRGQQLEFLSRGEIIAPGGKPFYSYMKWILGAWIFLAAAAFTPAAEKTPVFKQGTNVVAE